MTLNKGMVHTNYNNNTSKTNALAMQLFKQRSHIDEKITHYMILYDKEHTHREQRSECQNCWPELGGITLMTTGDLSAPENIQSLPHGSSKLCSTRDGLWYENIKLSFVLWALHITKCPADNIQVGHLKTVRNVSCTLHFGTNGIKAGGWKSVYSRLQEDNILQGEGYRK